MVGNWSHERIVLTGGAGFLGSFVQEELRRRGARDVFVPRSHEYDLVDMAAVRRLYADAKPTLVIHLAARVGGIGANRDNPGKFFYDNLMMGVQLIEVGRQVGLEEARRARHHLRLPEVRAGAVQGRRHLERLSGGDERSVWPGEEDAARPEPGLPAAVRVQLLGPVPGEPLRAEGQLRPAQLARHPGAHPEVRRGARARGQADCRLGRRLGLAGVPPCPRRRRGNRRRLRAVRQERAGEPGAGFEIKNPATWCP